MSRCYDCGTECICCVTKPPCSFCIKHGECFVCGKKTCETIKNADGKTLYACFSYQYWELGTVDKKPLEIELEKHGLTIEKITETWEKIVEVFKKAWEVVKDFFSSLTDALIKATARNPKHYHLYKHAKKRRTRKKYRNKLLREAVAYTKKKEG